MSCRRLWLRYLVEYEAFSRSGRWTRGLISDADAAAITPEAAVAHFNGPDWYLYGGSYFGGIPGRRSGPMRTNSPITTVRDRLLKTGFYAGTRIRPARR